MGPGCGQTDRGREGGGVTAVSKSLDNPSALPSREGNRASGTPIFILGNYNVNCIFIWKRTVNLTCGCKYSTPRTTL